ncbi:MAG: ankyrin repeat domain-containing protein [Sedimentisphaerales bacterium]|nr:ankyrin repeat domain-containing protein [Sedimentisphaerales bacterium]
MREFADNVLKYGRDTYGPKKTPLFVDGLNINNHEPVRWMEPNGDKWVLSNLSSQQTLFRTLDGLTTITGDPKYKHAAMGAIEYAFEHLQTSNGLLPWGGHQAYDATADKTRGLSIHELKGIYPNYRLMWQANPQATKQYIEAFWSAHVIDWSNLDMNRHAKINERVEKPWNHEYKPGTAFEGEGLSFFNTASDLIYAAVELTRLSGNKEPVVWARRLTKRYVDVRDPNTGISYGMYTSVKKQEIPDSYDSVLRKLVSGATNFPVSMFPSGMMHPKIREVSAYDMPTPGIRVHRYLLNWLSLLMVGETLGGSEGEELKHWALEELTAFGKYYRKKDNVYIPMLTDGTNIEGYVVKVDGPLGPKGATLEPVPAGSSDLWIYTMGYRVMNDAFMWEIARNISKGCGFGDIGKSSEDASQLNLGTDSSDPYAILSFLELHRATGKNEFLELAKKIGSNVLDNRLHKGFFVASKKHTYSKFDTMDSLALLHLYSVLVGRESTIPQAYPSTPFYEGNYRKKEYAIDNQIFYTFTEFSEPPISIQEAAAVGDITSIRSLLEKGVEVDAVENTIYRTALHRAAKGGYMEVVQLLLTEGANVEATDSWPGATPLYYGVEQGYREIVELLIAHGADIHGTIKYPAGDTPLHCAARKGHKDIVDLLISKGADVNSKNDQGETPLDVVGGRYRKEICGLLVAKGAKLSSIHLAAELGALAQVEVLLEEGIDVNAKDEDGKTPLHLAVQEDHKDVVQALVSKGADVNAKDNKGMTPIHLATLRNLRDIIDLLISKGANVNTKNEKGETPLDIGGYNKEIAPLLISAGARTSTIHNAALWGLVSEVRRFLDEGVDVNAKNEDGWTPLHLTAQAGRKDVMELLIAKGADVNAPNSKGQTPLQMVRRADEETFKELMDLLLSNGANLNAKDDSGCTLLDDVALGRSEPEIFEFLLSKGADANNIHLAAYRGDVNRVKSFLKEGADINEKRTTRQRTPLDYAVKGGKVEAVRLLIAEGADINAGDKDTPVLIQAVISGNTEIAGLLLANGADLNVVGSSMRMTALHTAVLRGNKEMVQLLIDKGADVNVKVGGRTALDVAKLLKRQEIIDLLKKHGAKE